MTNQTDPLDAILYDYCNVVISDEKLAEAKAAINAEIAKAVREELYSLTAKAEFLEQADGSPLIYVRGRVISDRLDQLKEDGE